MKIQELVKREIKMKKYILGVIYVSDDGGLYKRENNSLVGVFSQEDVPSAKEEWVKENIDEDNTIKWWTTTPIDQSGKVIDYPIFQDP